MKPRHRLPLFFKARHKELTALSHCLPFLIHYVVFYFLSSLTPVLLFPSSHRTQTHDRNILYKTLHMIFFPSYLSSERKQRTKKRIICPPKKDVIFSGIFFLLDEVFSSEVLLKSSSHRPGLKEHARNTTKQYSFSCPFDTRVSRGHRLSFDHILPSPKFRPIDCFFFLVQRMLKTKNI